MPVPVGLSPTVHTANLRNLPEETAFFTGRQDAFDEAHARLHNGECVAFYGMSGIGKTRTAIEYANRFGSEYNHVFWVVADTPSALLTGYADIARSVLPQLTEEPDQNKIAKAVREWLHSNPGWLLIFDNVDILDVVREHLPNPQTGHVLLTSVLSSFGNLAHGIKLSELSPEEGATLLLRRAKRIEKNVALDASSPEDRKAALALSQQMQGLPLALDQAGAYIEDTGRTPAQYLDLYQRRSADLLAKRGNNPTGHPNPVTVTFSLALEKLKQVNPASVALLRACAFLAPTPIPCEMFTWNMGLWDEVLGPIVTDEINWDKTLKAARNLSLIQTDNEHHTITIHHLVQQVIKIDVTDEQQAKIAELHVGAIDGALRHYAETSDQHINHETFFFAKFMPHIAFVGVMVQAFKAYTVEAARLYYNAGLNLLSHAVYIFAKDLLSFAIEIMLHLADADNINLAEPYNRLGMCYYELGNYDVAEQFYKDAIRISEKYYGVDHESVGIYYDNLSACYVKQEKHDDAFESSQKASTIINNATEMSLRDKAITLCNQAAFYSRAGSLAKAEELWHEAIQIIKDEYGPDDYTLALPMQNLAMSSIETEQHEEAEQLLLKSLAVMKAEFGTNSPRLVQVLNNLGSFYMSVNLPGQAEEFLGRAVEIMQKTQGASIEEYVRALNNLGTAIQNQERYDEAEPHLEASLELRKETYKENHPETAMGYKNLGVLRYF